MPNKANPTSSTFMMSVSGMTEEEALRVYKNNIQVVCHARTWMSPSFKPLIAQDEITSNQSQELALTTLV